MSGLSEANFTSGPWVAKMQFGEWFVRQDPAAWGGMGYQLICNLPASRKATHYGEMFRANACLIAAAPDLLRALQMVISVADRSTVEFDAAHAAVAKALGQTEQVDA